MNKQDYEKLNDLSVSLGQLTSLIELAEDMMGEYACGNVKDDEEKARSHIGRLWALMKGLVEMSHLRENDVELLLKSVSVIENAPKQSAMD